MMIEQSISDASVFSALSDASKATEQLNKKLDIDKLEDIKEKLDDQRAEMEEKTEFFMQAANLEDADELLGELDELEAQYAAEELENIEIGSGAINAGKGGIPEPVKPMKTKSA
jgi:Icc-related predicted phosphoesterase